MRATFSISLGFRCTSPLEKIHAWAVSQHSEGAFTKLLLDSGFVRWRTRNCIVEIYYADEKETGGYYIEDAEFAACHTKVPVHGVIFRSSALRRYMGFKYRRDNIFPFVWNEAKRIWIMEASEELFFEKAGFFKGYTKLMPQEKGRKMESAQICERFIEWG